jgi:hypothetical protein
MFKSLAFLLLLISPLTWSKNNSIYANLNENPESEYIYLSNGNEGKFLKIKTKNSETKILLKEGNGNIDVCSLNTLKISKTNIKIPEKPTSCSSDDLFCNIANQYLDIKRKNKNFKVFAIKLDDGSCDSIYLYWDIPKQQFNLIRLN